MQQLTSWMHIRSRVLSTLLHIFALGTSAACAGDSEHADSTRTGDRFRVALLTPGPISDQSWNAGAYEGLMRIRDSLGGEVSHIQTTAPAEFEENFRLYGAQGYDLVFGHGFEFQDAAVRVGGEFPNTVYVTTSGNRSADNVAGLVFGFEDASYLAGVIAAGLTRSGVVGIIGGTELPPVKSSFDAFEAGVRATRSDVRLVSAYIGSWNDVNAGKEQALAQIARGADVIFQNADAAGRGIFTAASEAGDVLVFGSNSNQNSIAPDVIIGSVVIDLPRALTAVAREVKDGTFRGRVISFGARDSVVTLVMNPRLESRVPAAARQKADSLREAMMRGEFHPPQGRFADSTSR